LRPVAVKIDVNGSAKDLLTEGLEENHVPRKWSLWRKTDPVALFEGKVIECVPNVEFAAHYHGNVFTFSTEENLNKFLA
jgi:YHS domain-containing protein